MANCMMLKQDSESCAWVEIRKVSEKKRKEEAARLQGSTHSQITYFTINSVWTSGKIQRCSSCRLKYATALLNKLSGSFCVTQECLTETFGSTGTIQAAAVLKKIHGYKGIEKHG